MPFMRRISEELVSMEEKYSTELHQSALDRFQKNQLVWKFFICPIGLILPSQFQKNQLVWKQIGGGRHCRKRPISEELVSMEADTQTVPIVPRKRLYFRRTSQYGSESISLLYNSILFFISEELVSMEGDGLVICNSYPGMTYFRRTSQYGSRNVSPTLSLIGTSISEELVSMEAEVSLFALNISICVISEELVSMEVHCVLSLT